MPTGYDNTPGIHTYRKYDATNIFVDPSRVEYAPNFAFIDGSLSRYAASSVFPSLLPAGLLFGKITASGKLRPSIIGLTTAAIAAGTIDSVTVSPAVAAELVRLRTLAGGNLTLTLAGPPAAGGTVASKAFVVASISGSTVSFQPGSTPAFIAGSLVMPADGSENPVVPLANQTGVDVVNLAGNSIDQPFGQVVRKADLLTAVLPYYVGLDVSIKAYLKAKLKAIGLYTFDDDRGL